MRLRNCIIRQAGVYFRPRTPSKAVSGELDGLHRSLVSDPPADERVYHQNPVVFVVRWIKFDVTLGSVALVSDTFGATRSHKLQRMVYNARAFEDS